MPELTLKQYFAERLKALRDERKWTLQEVADKIGVSMQMIWIYEQGTVDPPYSRVLQFAAIFNVPAETFNPALTPVASEEG